MRSRRFSVWTALYTPVFLASIALFQRYILPDVSNPLKDGSGGEGEHDLNAGKGPFCASRELPRL
jgi:hypothetical protein